MAKRFNVTGRCYPSRHYMVNIEDKLTAIRRMVDDGDYFVMNRARQYGKTTTLGLLATDLRDSYVVISLDFQKLSHAKFENEQAFVQAFGRQFLKQAALLENRADGFEELAWKRFEAELLAGGQEYALTELFEGFSTLCGSSQKPVVLLIDEVDSASNYQVFLDFLAQLRAYYLDREETPTFWSVILAGVHDPRNLKARIRPDAEHKQNSPWNIAEAFRVDMSFSIEGICGMLKEYEADHDTGMDVQAVAREIYEYTSGYPVLVSRICKALDEEVAEAVQPAAQEELQIARKNVWTRAGVSEAAKRLIEEEIPLFESLKDKVDTITQLRQFLLDLLMKGVPIPYRPYDDAFAVAKMYGFVKVQNGVVVVANRIFETLLYEYFLTSVEMKQTKMYSYGNNEKYQFINGKGNYYIEAQTRDQRRMDVVVDYCGKRYVIEMKIWHGNAYNERGEEQLLGYLDYFGLQEGYLLSFNFNREKRTGVQELAVGGRTIVEAVV